MRNWKITLTSLGVLTLALSLAAMAAAQQGKAAREGFGPDAAGMSGVRQFVRGLQLTETQKEEIRSVLQAHKTEMLAAREAVLQARIALVKEDPNGPGEFGAAQTRLMAVVQGVLTEIRTKLTAEQLATVQEREQKKAARLERMLQRLQKRGGI